MKQYKKELGKVSVSAEGKWNIEKPYERISMVFDEYTEQAFISKCDVPAGIDLYNREYWMPLNVSGYSDSNIIILNKKINDSKIKSYTLEEAVKSIKPVGRKLGCILVFYNSNSERLDIGGCWEIWQFNDINVYNWENIKSWQNIYHNYNKFVGWYPNEEILKKYNPFPEIGCYAYVGSELNNSVVFRCDSKYIWIRTKENAKDYVKVILDGTITIGENGNWYQNGEDTNIPASVKGDNGKTPFIRNVNNILEYSYDEIEWKPISEQIAAWFRWKAGDVDKHHIGNIQISRDNVSWQNLSGDIVSSLHISKHIGINEQLPTNVAEGTIIAKRTNSTDTTSYELFVYAYNESNVLAWVSHGIFTSISVGLTQEIGNNENVVMSQKAVTKNLNVINDNIGISEYPVFSASKAYAVGDVVQYDGLLYHFTIAHEVGAWNVEQVESWSEKKEREKEVAELTSKINIQTTYWVKKGLNNTGEDLVMDINSDYWLQSNWLDFRLLNKISLNITGTTMYIVVTDGTIDVNSSIVKKGHWSTLIIKDAIINNIQQMAENLPFNALFCRIWIYSSDKLSPNDITDENFSIEYLTNTLQYKNVFNLILDSLIKEVYVVGADRGTVSIKNIHRQGGSTSDTRGYIVGQVGNTAYNIVLENAPSVPDMGNNIIKAIVGDAIIYFLIDWEALAPGTGTSNKTFYKLSDNAYTLTSNPQIAEYLSAEFHSLVPKDLIEGKYVYQTNGSIYEEPSYNIHVYPISANRRYRIKGELHGTTTFAIYSNYSDGELLGLLYLFPKNENGNIPIDEIIQGYNGYLAVSWNSLNVDVYTDGLDNIFSDIEDLQYRLASNIKLALLGSIQGYIDENGYFVEHESYTSDSYTLVSGEKYRILGTYKGIKGVAALSFWTDDTFRKTIVDTNAITDVDSTISIDTYFTVPLGINRAYITNTYGNTLFLYKVDKINKIDSYTKSDIDEKLRTSKVSLLKQSWSRHGLNNTSSVLRYNIVSTQWLQSDWIDARLLDSISLSNPNYTLYIALVGSNDPFINGYVQEGNWKTYQTSRLINIQKLIDSLTFNAVFAKLWVHANDMSEIDLSHIDDLGFNITYNVGENKDTQLLLNNTVIFGSPISDYELRSNTYVRYTGELMTNSSYATRIYSVVAGETYKVKGSVRGTKSVGCYALYTGEEASVENLHSIVTIQDIYGGSFEGAQQVSVDSVVIIPDGVTLLAATSVPEDNDDMLLYDIVKTKEYIDEKLEVQENKIKYVDCLGDSLTMGAVRFGWYEDTLQELLGDKYKVRNWGVGGESSASIMARQGSDSIKFQDAWVLKADGTSTEVMNTSDNSLIIKTQTTDKYVALLLQGAANDTEQKTRVVNPCYINGVPCTMTYTQVSTIGIGKWYIRRNNIGDKDVTISANTPVYFNTGKEMANSDITIIWMGTNDGVYSDWQELVDRQIMAADKVSNKKYIVIGLHKIGKTEGEKYEKLMWKAFGNKFFNIREYMCSNMIYDAGIEPTDEDLTDMANGDCPKSLLYDGTHLKPESNIALGKMLYNLCLGLGYVE